MADFVSCFVHGLLLTAYTYLVRIGSRTRLVRGRLLVQSIFADEIDPRTVTVTGSRQHLLADQSCPRTSTTRLFDSAQISPRTTIESQVSSFLGEHVYRVCVCPSTILISGVLLIVCPRTTTDSGQDLSAE